MTSRQLWRRVVIVAVVVTQLTLIGRGYAGHREFAFQMFPESSQWQAEIYRVDFDGERDPLHDDWEYRWWDLVQGQGLTNPFVLHHAGNGLDTTFDLFQRSLDWVALNTPDDADTDHLEAEVTYWHNGRGPFQRSFVSVTRTAGDS